jgi:hypothetical protein
MLRDDFALRVEWPTLAVLFYARVGPGLLFSNRKVALRKIAYSLGAGQLVADHGSLL